MTKLIILFIALLTVMGCGSGGSTTPANPINTVTLIPIINISNVVPNAGTGHLNGQELTLVDYTVENPTEPRQILRNVSCSLYDSNNSLIDYYEINYSFLQDGSTWITAHCTNKIVKINANGSFRVEAYAIDINGVKSNTATTTFNWP